ncbi:hypothetical protein [Dyella japonica]|uniref:DUF5636 domain-containing protein n=1 Tax=Dyella japonica A8 TaxID=1217721 RepID=A0A075K7V6_9GAMM|nr:hypothetical protein [Dyella japonica]AIF48233.1 hypothetical protein HY57_13725 [Dyella japonica A8]
MSVNEIEGFEEAKRRLTLYFGDGAFKSGDLDKASQLLDFLSSKESRARFTSSLDELSRSIWVAYNNPEIMEQSNRFTAAIIRVGAGLGFSCQENVVFVGALDGRAFGDNLKGKVLWKDSFAVDHGEFSHSYQWLAAGEALGWHTGTADFYKNVAEIRSVAPLFVIDNGRLAYRRAPLWEYLVDCTNYSDGKCSESNRRDAVSAYVDAQLARLKSGDFVDPYFANEYLRKVYKTELFQDDGKWKAEFDSIDKRKARKSDIGSLVLQGESTKGDLIATFKLQEQGKFDFQNAITTEFSAGGTYRSPNNVTYLVRSKADWFINSYQLHRAGRRAPFDESLYPSPEDKDGAKRGVLGRRAMEGVAKLEDQFGALRVSTLDRDRQVTGERAPGKREIASGTVKHVNDRHGNLITTPLPTVALDVRGRSESFRSTNPIEGTRYAQHKNYLSKNGFVEVAPNVYRRSADAREIIRKEQLSAEYHGVAGLINAGLKDSISISK